MRLGLLTNTKSGRNKRGFERVEAPFRDAGAALFHFDGSVPLAELACEVRGARIELLALNSGDGMVQGFWSALLEAPPENWPIMALLPSGTTNMTHADLGLRDTSPKRLAQLIALAKNDDVQSYLVERGAVRVDHLKEGPQCGAFFGAAAIVEAIQICKERFHSHGYRGDIAHGLTVLRMLYQMLRGKGRISKMGGLPVSVGVEEQPPQDQRVLLFIASTLERLLFKSRPFWGVEDAPLRASWVGYPAPHFARLCFRLMAGGNLANLSKTAYPPPAYRSVNARSLSLKITESVVLDGEFYTPLPDQPLCLSTTPKARFVRL